MMKDRILTSLIAAVVITGLRAQAVSPVPKSHVRHKNRIYGEHAGGKHAGRHGVHPPDAGAWNQDGPG